MPQSLPTDAQAAPDESADLARRIGDWAVRFSPSARRLARISSSIRDFSGCVIAGTRRPELRPALWLAHGGGVPVWGLADSFDPAGAALIAGTAGSLLQLHDIFAPAGLHPSSPVIPAAWSALRGHPGVARPESFVRAVAAGYEATNRIGLACSPGQGQAGSATTGTAGALGAAVAAGLVLGLDATAIGRAVSNAALFLAATPTAALRSHGASTPLHSGIAARAGYEAAIVAREAGAGRCVLEGDGTTPGLIRFLRGSVDALVPENWGGETLDAIAWKFFPACFASHTALEGLLRLPRVDAGSIRRVTITLPSRMLWLVDSGPTEGQLYDRLMSLRWVAARALEQGAYSYRSSADDNAETRALAGRITIREAPALDALQPQTLAANIELVTADRTHRVEHRRAPTADPATRGPRGWTLSNDEAALSEKFAALAGDSLGQAGEVLALLGS